MSEEVSKMLLVAKKMTKFLIYRPIAVLMSTLAFIIIGLVLASLLPVSLMPEVDIPKVSVQLSYPNTSAQELEQLATTPLRRQLLQVAHLDHIESESRDGHALIRMKFDYGSEIDYTFLEVNEKIDAVMGMLPRDMARPHIIKASATDLPVFYLNINLADTAAGADKFLELSEFSGAILRKRIEQLSEVAMVDMTGRTFPQINILPDQAKMHSLGISQSDIQQALKSNNLSLGNLRVREGQYEYHIRFSNFLRSPKDIGEIYLNKNQHLLQLKDIAQIVLLPQEQTGLYLSHTQPAIGMAIIKQADARMADMKKAVTEVVELFETDYPDIHFEFSQDQSQLLEVAIGSLRQALLMGAGLAFLIMFFFLQDLKSPLLIGLTIPTSLTVCLLLFYLLDISINLISLSGLILGVGLMIDNSIIVIDNIFQHRERGLSLGPACIEGTNEVIRPLISSALTTSAVFLPLIFLSGISGALFYDQAMAITIGLGVSLFVSITLLPTLYRLLYLKGKKGIAQTFLQKFSLAHIGNIYEKSFEIVFRYKWGMMAVFIGLIIAAVFLVRALPLERFPALKQQEVILSIDWNQPLHTVENRVRIRQLLKHTATVIQQSNTRIGAQQFVLNQKHEMGTSEAQLYVKTQNEADLAQFIQKSQTWFSQYYAQAQYDFNPPPNIFEQLFASDEAPLVAEISQVRNNQTPALKQMQNSIQSLNQELHTQIPPIPTQSYIAVQLIPERLALYEVDHEQLYATLKAGFNAYQLDELNTQQQIIPIVMRLPRDRARSVIERTKVVNAKGEEIPVSALLRLRPQQDYKYLSAGKSGAYVPLSFEVSEGESWLLMSRIREILGKEGGLTVNFSGSVFNNRLLVKELALVLGISLLLLYFILAAQFESLLQPFIVLLEVPMDVAGACLLLYLTGSSLNLMAMIGIIVMSGIIINDSILKIDTINRLRKGRHSLLEAIHIGGKRRLKPILMTSLTTILATLPLLFGDDLGTSLQRPLALALIGGMSLGTLVSLYFIPLAYWWIYRK